MITMIKLAILNIKENKKWAMMTIVGISVSLMLITMVVSLGTGTYQSLKKEYINSSETWNVQIELDTVKNQDRIDSLDSYFENIDSIERYLISSSYGYISSEDNNYSDTVWNFNNVPKKHPNDLTLIYQEPVLVKGRLPQNDNEIVLGQFQMNNREIGDSIVITKNDDTSIEVEIVGITEYFGASVKGRSYQDSELIVVAIEFKDGANMKSVVDQIENDFTTSYIAYHTMLNSLRGLSFAGNELLMTTLILIGIIVGVISLSSMSLIYNSFYLSLEQKVQQIGLLKSIGATNKQISIMVYFEGLLLTLISITIGIAGGYFLAGQALNYIGMVFSNIANTLYLFKPVLTPLVIILIYVAGIFTVILPISKSVRFANKVSPVETIRNVSRSDDKLKYKKVSKFVERNFKTSGVLAVKNYHRDRKKHRSTSISLVITIVLFISITSFVDYAKKIVSTAVVTEYDLSIHNFKVSEESVKVLYEIGDTIKSEFPTSTVTKYRAKQLQGVGIEDVGYPGIQYPLKEQFQDYDFSDYWVDNTMVVLSDEDFALFFGKENLDKTVFKNSIRGKLPYKEEGKEKILYVDSEFVDVKVGDTFEYDFIVHNVNNFEPTSHIKSIDVDIVVNELPFSIAQRNDYDGIKTVISDTKFKALGFVELFSDVDSYSGFENEIIVLSQQYDEIEKRANKLINSQVESDGFPLQFFVFNKTADTLLITSIFGSVDIATKLVTAFIVIICISNLLNVLASSSRQRLKEYGVYLSVGMDIKSLRRMVFYESIINSWKPLIIGVLSGVGLSLLMYKVLNNAIMLDGFRISWSAVAMAILMVVVVQMVQLITSMLLLKQSNIVQDLKRMEM